MTHTFLQKNTLEATQKPYTMHFTVRDYECDMQGHVNNGVYFNYFEHARHEFLNEKQLSLQSLNEQGVQLVATRVEIDYKRPLKTRDSFYIETQFEPISRIQYCFTQLLYKDSFLYAQANVYAVAINKLGKPIKLKSLDFLK